MTDNMDSHLSMTEKLAALLKYEAAWIRLYHQERTSFLYGDLFCVSQDLICYTASGQQGESGKLSFKRPASAIRGVEEKTWSVPFTRKQFGDDALVIDPSQDLLVFVEWDTPADDVDMSDPEVYVTTAISLAFTLTSR